MGATEILCVSVLALGIGSLTAYLLRHKIKSSNERAISKIINDPELLLKKLNENGKMVDFGEEMEYKIKEVDGNKTLILEKKKVHVPKEEKREPAKKKTKKAIKKVKK